MPLRIGQEVQALPRPRLSQVDARARLAAANNADLHAFVFAAHGLAFRRDAAAFVSAAPPPPWYASMTTLDPDAVARQRAEIDGLRAARPEGFALKDGFRRLDLAPLGFGLLFEATWIHAANARFGPSPAGWERVLTPEGLAAWEDAFGAPGAFPPALLAAPALAFFGRRCAPGGPFDAGCVANVSPACVGLSNVFGPSHADAARCAAAFGRGRPVVGYERGEALDAALAAGFAAVGGLRVWRTKP